MAKLVATIWQDAFYTLRTMRKQPAFAATAVITLALAIGGNTAMFTVIPPRTIPSESPANAVALSVRPPGPPSF